MRGGRMAGSDQPFAAPPAKPTPKPKAPAKIGAAGRKLWRAMVEQYEFEAHELTVLEAACRQADHITVLEEQVRVDGLMVPGSKGQQRLHPAVAEVRLARGNLSRLLGQLKLPSEEAPDKPLSARGRQAQHAANQRWARHRERRGDHLQPVADLEPLEPATRRRARSGRNKSAAQEGKD